MRNSVPGTDYSEKSVPGTGYSGYRCRRQGMYAPPLTLMSCPVM